MKKARIDKKVVGSLVTVFVISGAFAACGQNPNVTRGDVQELTQPKTLAQAPAPVVQDPALVAHDGLNGKDGVGGPVGPAGVAGLAGKDGINGKDGLNGKDGVAGPAGPAGVAGKDGLAGKNGIDGKDGVAGRDGVSGCGIRPFTAIFEARPLNQAERDEVTVLPYVSTLNHPVAAKRHKVSTLQFGHMSGLAGNVPYVRNSQTLFAIDVVGLPPRAAIVSVDSLALKMRVTKISADAYLGTEMLCFLDEKICSGETFEAANWKDNINPFFFSEHSGPVNRNFAKQYLDHEVGKVNGEKIYAANLTMELSSLLEGAADIDAGKLLYGAESANHRVAKRTLHMAVADDTYVHGNARLVIAMQEDTCITAQLSQPALP